MSQIEDFAGITIFAYSDFLFQPWANPVLGGSPEQIAQDQSRVQELKVDEVFFSEYATFSSSGQRIENAEGSTDEADPFESSILRMDPPRHRYLRSLVSQAFTPRMVAQLEPRISAITNDLLDHVAATGEMDVVRDLAYPLPVTVIAELLGIPAELREDFKRSSDALVTDDGDTSEEERKALFQEVQGMYAYFTEVLEERRRHPQNDLVTASVSNFCISGGSKGGSVMVCVGR